VFSSSVVRDNLAEDVEMGCADVGGSDLGKNLSAVYARQWDLIRSQLGRCNIDSPLVDGVKMLIQVIVCQENTCPIRLILHVLNLLS
jgi:hypothetical protein